MLRPAGNLKVVIRSLTTNYALTLFHLHVHVLQRYRCGYLARFTQNPRLHHVTV